MLDDIVKFRSFSEEKQNKTIMKYMNLNDDEKTILEIRLDLSDNEYLLQKYFDFQQEVDEYKERQEKKNRRKR